MHLPDGSLDNVTCTVTTLLAAGAVGYACRRARRESERWNANALAATSAVVFAAQMVNFPVADSVSGHMVGGTLAGVLLGPWLGLVAMALVLVAQCLLAGDGGLTTLGANVLTMGVVATWGGVALRNAVSPRANSLIPGVGRTAIAAWASVVAAGIVCALIWGMGGDVPLVSALGPMAAVHARIGLGEALITAAVLVTAQLWSTRSSTVAPRAGSLMAAALAMAVAVLLAPWGSPSPDGLESVAGNWAHWSQGGFALAPLPDYLLPGVANEALATALAGTLGVLVVYLAAHIGAWRGVCAAKTQLD